MDQKEITILQTKDHISEVRKELLMVINNLADRAQNHDASKMSDIEVDTFVEFTPKLKNSTYGSEEYKGFLEQMKPALDHHYANNSHHPEFRSNGILGMSLFDLIEMICDWRAATRRHADGDIFKSIEINQKRFGYGNELKQIFLNTVNEIIRLEEEKADGG